MTRKAVEGYMILYDTIYKSIVSYCSNKNGKNFEKWSIESKDMSQSVQKSRPRLFEG